MSPEVNLLSLNVIFLQTESEILHQYPVFFRHQGNISLTLREETIPVMDFIKRLIRHISQKYYKMIRYGSIYAHH